MLIKVSIEACIFFLKGRYLIFIHLIKLGLCRTNLYNLEFDVPI